MTFEELDNLIPNEGSQQRARRPLWPDNVYIERGGCALFRQEEQADGTIKHVTIYPGFHKVYDKGAGNFLGVSMPYIAHDNWKPSDEDREADDWELL